MQGPAMGPGMGAGLLGAGKWSTILFEFHLH